MKTVYKCDYVHISAISEMYTKYSELKLNGGESYKWAILRCLNIFLTSACLDAVYSKKQSIKYFLSEESPIIVKVDRENLKISFIIAMDWITAMEPEINFIFSYSMEAKTMVGSRRGSGQIYHSKELFVKSDYKGFDIDVAQARTTEWNERLKEISKNKIGYKKYWKQICVEHGLAG